MAPMIGQEFYVRGINDPEARGPFTLEQLVSLAEAGQITVETYFYDSGSEQWLAIGGNSELKAALWPEKRRLGFKAKEFKAVNVERAEGEAPITVEQFLAAAEGQTEETKGRKDKSLRMMSAAICGSRGAAIIMLISATALVLPGIDAIMSFDIDKILAKPLVILGALDALLGILVLLGLIGLYPFVRFRAMFGLGFLGFVFWTQGNLTGMMALAAGCAGLYFSTIFLSYLPLGVALLVGVSGMAALTTISFS